MHDVASISVAIQTLNSCMYQESCSLVMYMYLCLYLLVGMCVCICVCAYVCVHMCVCICMYVYVHVCKFVYVCTIQGQACCACVHILALSCSFALNLLYSLHAHLRLQECCVHIFNPFITVWTGFILSRPKLSCQVQIFVLSNSPLQTAY